MVFRWLLGFFKRLFGIWDEHEWGYYTYTALDPKQPALQRWDVLVKTADKTPETPQEELLPRKTYTLVLHDKTGLTLEDVVYFSTELGKVEALEKKLKHDLQGNNCGWFWFKHIHQRNLDFIHSLKLDEGPLEGQATQDELEATRREFFRGG
jgi:hypothetical protein